MPDRNNTRRLIAVLLLVTHAVLLSMMAFHDGPVIDEVAHFSAGVSHHELGTFDLYKVNPPLVRVVAAMPPLVAGVETDWSRYGVNSVFRSDFDVGSDFFIANPERWPWLMFLARLGCLPFSLIGALVCYFWSKRLFGSPAALVALAMWSFSPTILAWGHTILPDVGAASLGVLLFYRFRIWLDDYSVANCLIVGVCLGLTLLTKGTWVFLFAMLPVLFVLHAVTFRKELDGILASAVRLVALFLVGLTVLNGGYLFEGSFTRLGEFEFVSSFLTGYETPAPGTEPIAGNRFLGSVLEDVPVPFPANYVGGLDWIKWELERGYSSFLRGQWKHGGWWYYYFYSLAIKVPLGFIGLGLTAILMFRSGSLRGEKSSGDHPFFEDLYLFIPLAFILGLATLQDGFSHHLRYILPIFPFAIILISRVGRTPLTWVRCWVGGLLAWGIVSSLSVFPHSLGYFNEVVSPENGHLHLSGSSLDWGQNLFYVLRWKEEHEFAHPFFYAARNPYVEVSEAKPPTTRQLLEKIKAGGEVDDLLYPGWYAISRSNHQHYCFLSHLPIHDTVAYSTVIYQVTASDIEVISDRLKLVESKEEMVAK